MHIQKNTSFSKEALLKRSQIFHKKNLETKYWYSFLDYSQTEASDYNSMQYLHDMDNCLGTEKSILQSTKNVEDQHFAAYCRYSFSDQLVAETPKLT